MSVTALSSAMPDPSGLTLRTDFAGRRRALLGLALRTSLLTLFTLGMYRFWMKSRLRRYYWSSVRPGGTPLEYMGEPMEKLLGFLIAVVFLAFYIGIVNLILMFASFAIFNGNVFAYAVSFIGVIPIIFFAQYRARRYLLGRTRWRGVRFALDAGAWGYAWRALVHWGITIVTLGLFWPRMTFWLEKYRTDRTLFGNQRLTQGGTWTMLLRPFLPVWILLALIVAAFASLGLIGNAQSKEFTVVALLLGVPLALILLVRYRVLAFRRLSAHKTAGQLGLIAEPRPWRLLSIYLFGGFFLIVFTLLPLSALGAAIFILGDAPSAATAEVLLARIALQVPPWLGIALSTLVYFATFLLWGALKQIFITLPRLRHYAETLQITGAEHFATVNQRAGFDFAEAEGFAEALDVGAAI